MSLFMDYKKHFTLYLLQEFYQMSKNVKSTLPIAQRIRRERRLPQYYQVVQGLKQLNIILYGQQFFQLGRGSFGKCYLGKIISSPNESIQNLDRSELIRNGQLIAVKVFPKSALKTTLQAYRHEVQMLHSLSGQCQNLVKLIIDKAIESDKNYYMVTEYCNNCTLFDLIENRRQEKRMFTLWEFIQIALDLTEGYLAMRKNKIMHNDLKPQNIFIKDKVFKIGDFGLALRLSTEGQVPCGTLLYCAPEKLQQRAQKRDIDHKADIYALGLVLHEVLYGCHPYWQQSSYQKLKQEQRKRLKQLKREPVSQKDHKRLKKSIFLKYIMSRPYQKREVQLQPILGGQALHESIISQLQILVHDMCMKEKQERISLQIIKDRMERLALRAYIHRDDLFTDLQELSQSELRFQMANMSRMAVDKVQLNSIRFSEKMKGTQAIDIKLVGKMKQRLFVIFDFFKLLRTLREQVQWSIKSTVGLGNYLSSSFPQIMTNYLYAINRRELQLANQQLLIMSAQQLRVAIRQDILTDLRQLKLNDEELHKDAQFGLEADVQVYRKSLMDFIKERLRNEMIKAENWSEVLAWVLLYTVVRVQQRHEKRESRDQMGQQLARIQGRMNLFKLQALTGEDWLLAKEILQENEQNFVYFYEISDE